MKLSLYKSTIIKGKKELVMTLINVVAPKGAVVFWLLKEPFVVEAWCTAFTLND